MKHMVFLAITLFAAPAWAQAPKEPAKEAAKPQAMKEAAKPEAMKEATAAKKPQQPRRWNEDARHCLERPSNTEVIKCAEEFL
jgi:hypothetical protein